MPDVPASTFIESERLWYRAPEASDAPLIASWRNNPRVRRTISRRFPSTAEATRKWIEGQNPSERGIANTHAALMFGPRGAADAIGYAGLFGIDWINRHAEFGITLDPAHWNRGFGREVTGRIVQYAFEELNLRRVELDVFSSNRGGINAYRAAGFVHEGTRRQSDSIDGRWEDVHFMAVLQQDWLAQRSNRDQSTAGER